MLKFFGEVSLAGFFLNLLVLPSVGFVLTGGMAALLLGIFCIPAAKLAILPARGLLLFYEYLCSLAGKLRWSTWIGGEPEIWQILVYYVFLITVLFMGQYIKEPMRREQEAGMKSELSSRDKRIPGKIQRKLRTVRAAAGALMITGILILGFHPAGDLKVTCLDVGQGDGILVETPDNHHFLIDGGSSSQSDLGRYCLLPALKSQGISYLDGLFISHTDKDHISGAKELLEYMGNVTDKLTLNSGRADLKTVRLLNRIKLIKRTVDCTIAGCPFSNCGLPGLHMETVGPAIEGRTQLFCGD